MFDSKERLTVICLAAVAVVLGIVAIFALGWDNPYFIDSPDYIAAARSLLTDGTYPSISSLPFFRAPLYPMFMAAVWSITSENAFAVKLVQVALHAGFVVMIYAASKILTGDRLAAGIGGLMAVTNPFFLYHAAAIQTETLHTFLVMLGMLATVALLMNRGPEIRMSVIAGIAFGLAALCKPSALGVGIVATVILVLLGFRSGKRLAVPAVIVAAMFLTILPWSFYNEATKGEFILINDAGGYALWLGNHEAGLPLYESTFNSGAEREEYQEYVSKTLAAKQIEEWEATRGYSGLSLSNREALWREAAIEKIRSDPPRSLRLFAWKLWGFLKPNLNREVYGEKAAIASTVYMVLVWVLALIGFVQVGRDPRTHKALWFLAVVVLFVTAAHMVIVSNLRLRIPYIDPWLMVFAGSGIAALIGRLPGPNAAQTELAM